MNKLYLLAISIITLANTALHANILTITNATNEKLKVGLFASALNYTTMTFAALETREYSTDIAEVCIKKITINGTEVWSGNNCDNYTLNIQKNNNGTYKLNFGPSDKPAIPATDPLQGLHL